MDTVYFNVTQDKTNDYKEVDTKFSIIFHF